MRNIKTAIIAIMSVLSVLLLAACGGDSGTGSDTAQAETIYNLGECEESNEGVIKLVTSEDQYYKCVDGDWEETEAPVQSSSSKKSTFSGSDILKDSRDGQTYRTVKIGDQVWMAENLNYRYLGPTAHLDSSSFCYEGDPANCAKYGRLYTWAAAMDSVGEWSTNGKGCGYGKECSATSPVRGICPEGWHLPSNDEWKALIVAVAGSITKYTSSNTAGTKLKSATGWSSRGNGTDAFGFSALPAGYRDYDGDYHYEGDDAYFWSSTEDFYNAYVMDLDCYYDGAALDSFGASNGFSVRCLKDWDGDDDSSSSRVSDDSAGSTYEVVTGTLTDSRDGQTYRTVKIGDQVWMAENLNYAYTGVPYRFYDEQYAKTYTYTSDSTSWCYDNDPANCAKYGRLYTWAAAMDSVGEWSTNGKGCGYGKECSVTSPVRGICPEGWHLPSRAEWDALIAAVDGSITEYTSSNTTGSKLKSATGWSSSGNGTDAFGFSARPAGARSSYGNYGRGRYNAYFWSSTENYSSYAYGMNLNYDYDFAYLSRNYKYDGFSVRCLKD